MAAVRLILAALKDRDIAQRGEGAELGDDQIMQLLQSMVKQRGESIKMYKEGGREDLGRNDGRASRNAPSGPAGPFGGSGALYQGFHGDDPAV